MAELSWKEFATYLYFTYSDHILIQDHFPEGFWNYQCLLPYMWKLILWHRIAHTGVSFYKEMDTASISVHIGKA